MDQNDHEIWLLKNDPAKLIGLYQELIRIIVRNYQGKGFVASMESDDLVQEINKELLGRFEKISMQYNGKSSLRTYFSVIIRNICRELFRKNNRVEESGNPEYHRIISGSNPHDHIVINQEYERFEKVMKLMLKDKSRFNLMLRFILDLRIDLDDIKQFSGYSSENSDYLLQNLNSSSGLSKKDMFERLSGILNVLEDRLTSPDSLRKWFKTRSSEFLNLMNGNPRRSSYTMESIQLLIEIREEMKKDD
jgi:RNA polymerase sigma factor (sigma-70 family)